MAIGGIPYRALKKARATDVVALSQPVFDEVLDVLHQPRLACFVDADLLSLHPWRGILIQRMGDYLARPLPPAISR